MGQTNRRRVVVVDDDPLFLSTLTLNLEDAGFEVAAFAGGAAALDHLTGGSEPDAIILDWHMPEMDGLELLQRVRAQGLGVPAIFLTSLSQPIYEELALDRGAVDFVEKSRSFAIILKRLRLITDGAKPAAAATAAMAPAPGAEAASAAAQRQILELRTDSCRALWRGTEVPLTLTEFHVVALLAGKGGGDVSYREIYDVVRGEGFIAGIGSEGYRSNVRTMVKRIRQKFRDLDPAFDALENYPGFGYRWRSVDA
ncbi:MAG TPA: response regulator transcription factor [Candidatus Sulfotelmatobacter sp.]|nr:response regulator transcription factor [Candidatus Sulfotelmatobacter sp.]